jgi:SAM-dependent methyltransferase
MNWVLLVISLAILGALVYWLLVITEGVFLGRRMVVWLYDLSARRYDSIKEFNLSDDSYYIARPVMHSLTAVETPLLLDVATGTGRVPWTLLQETGFEGFIAGVDASTNMLSIASAKLSSLTGDSGGSYSFVQQLAFPLPFADNTFDCLCCLEALEFFPSDEQALAEMMRVLKPGCMLLTSRRRGLEAKLFLGRCRNSRDFKALLHHVGFIDVQVRPWELTYDMVIAWKK